MSLFSFALLLSGYVNLHASSTPISSNDVSLNMSPDGSDLGLESLRTPISPPINLPLGQCSNFSFDNGTLSALCNILADDAGAPLGNTTTTVDLNKCIANEEGAIVYRAE
jgi:hypothetical protein